MRRQSKLQTQRPRRPRRHSFLPPVQKNALWRRRMRRCTKEQVLEIQAKNKLALKAMNKAHAHIKRDSQVADGFRQGIVEAKEKKAAAEVSMANQDRALSEAKTKRASRMTREAKTKHSANTAKKPAGEAEALTNGIVEKAEEVKSKARATNEAFKELSGKVAERTSKHERTGKSSHKEKKAGEGERQE
jgi:hypothetical protein